MQTDFNISGKFILRNASFNIVGKVIPLIIGFVSIPFIVKGLGVEQFGILSFIWVGLSNYFGLFDFGLGQATIKFTAQSFMDKEKKRLPELIWTSFVFNILLGILGTIIVLFLAPFLINHIFNISPDLRSIGLKSFFIAAFAVPIMTTTSVARGVLEGTQRYDYLNFIKIPLSSLFFLIPLISIFLGFKLPNIVFFLLIAQLGGAISYLTLCFKALPDIKEHFSINIKSALKLFNFGKWMALSNLVFTFLIQIDRFLIGAIVSMVAVGFYAALFDPLTRILILSESLIVLFPVFSAFSVSRKEEANFYYTRTLKHLLVIMGLVTIIIVFFASDILFLWFGPEFREKSTKVLQFLIFGIFAISLSSVGENLIEGFGRPDITTKLRFLEIPFYLPALWFFVSKFGISGAAAVWMVRAIIDALLILIISFKLSSINIQTISKAGIGRALGLLLLLGLVMLTGKLFLEGLAFFGFALFFLLVFVAIWWYSILDSRDIRFFKSILIREKQ